MGKRKNANEQLKAWMDGISKMELRSKEPTKEEQLRKELHQAIDELDVDMLYVIAESIGLR